jgi:hypothetical protein
MSSLSSAVNTTGISEIRHLDGKRTITLQVTPPPNMTIQETMTILTGAIESMKKDGKISNSVEVGISGAGRLNLRSQIGKLEIKSSGVAGVVLEGKADFAELISSGSSIIQSPNFKINDAEVKASGAANIKIQVINTLKVNASGSSIVKYFGNPKIKSRKVSSAASFNRL